MRSLVTGGAGFIGSHLVDALVAAGDEVVILDDLSTGRLENLAGVAERVAFIEGCVTDDATVARAVAGCDRVFHLAAVASVPATIERPIDTCAVNLTATLKLLEAARGAGAGRLVFASSAAVYGDRGAEPCAEDAAPAPMSPYAVEKLAAEQYVRVWPGLYPGLATVALRFFNVFGPRQDPSSPYSGVISIFADRLAAGRVPTVFGDGAQTRDFVYVGDVVRGLLAAGSPTAPSGVVCNLGRGESISLNTLYGHLAALLGGPPRPEYGPPRAGDIRFSQAVVDRARDLLGWRAEVSVADGLAALLRGG